MRIKHDSVSNMHFSHICQWFWTLQILWKQVFQESEYSNFMVTEIFLFWQLRLGLCFVFWIVWNYRVLGNLMVKSSKEILIYNHSNSTSSLLCCASTFDQFCYLRENTFLIQFSIAVCVLFLKPLCSVWWHIFILTAPWHSWLLVQ